MKIFTRNLTSKRSSGALAVSAAALLLTLPGCVVGPKYHPPAPQAPAPAYKESPANSQDNGDWTVAQPADAKLRGKWWEIFNDPELNALEEQLDINNQNIKEYFENYMEARAIVREARSQYFPTLTAAPAITHSRASANVGVPTSTTGGTTTTSTSQLQSTLYTLPLEASWEPDLWGKVRNTVRQAQYAAQVSAAELENERLTEQASLAQYFFEIRGQDKLQQIFDETVAADQKAYDLTRSLYETGIDDEISVVEAETTLRNAQAGATNVGVARAQYEHAIAVLIGKAATNFSIPAKPMTVAPPPIPVGVPSELLERRPDVAAAERGLAAATARIGVATADLYPTLSFTAAPSLQALQVGDLAKKGAFAYTVGPALSLPIFDLSVYARLRGANANEQAALASFEKAVLTALAETETSLDAYDQDRARRQSLSIAAEASRRATELASTRYQYGAENFLAVLDAEARQLAAEDQLAQSEIAVTMDLVTIYRALGGGWTIAPPPDK